MTSARKQHDRFWCGKPRCNQRRFEAPSACDYDGMRQILKLQREEMGSRMDAALANIQRLPPEAFPMLPPVIAGVLRKRNCTVPQPWTEGGARNVIQGEFCAKGQTGWAVLASVEEWTELLVFRHANDLDPLVCCPAVGDEYYLYLDEDDNPIGYSRLLTTVDREYITEHVDREVVPELPYLDHDGINDAVIAHSSVTWYYQADEQLYLPTRRRKV